LADSAKYDYILVAINSAEIEKFFPSLTWPNTTKFGSGQLG